MNAEEQTRLERDIVALIAELAEIDPSEVAHDRSLREMGVDSLMVLELVAFIEKRTCIEIPEEEISKVKCLDDIFARLKDGWGTTGDAEAG
jgi:acyl carrier protein